MDDGWWMMDDGWWMMMMMVMMMMMMMVVVDEHVTTIYQLGVQNQWIRGPKSILGGLLGGSWRVLGVLGGILGPSWPQDGPKSPKDLEKWFLGPPLGAHLGAQNRSKLVPRAIRKVIIFMITLVIDFWIDWVPTWPQLGLQNPPKMGPTWHPNRCKLGCWFESCFWKDLGIIFKVFLPQHTWPK